MRVHIGYRKAHLLHVQFFGGASALAMTPTRRSSRLMNVQTKNAATALSPPVVKPVKDQKRKVLEPEAASTDQVGGPSTPKRSRRDDVTRLLATPTTGAVSPIAEHHAIKAEADSNPRSKKPRSSAVTRLADPRITNATLVSPETSRVVASRRLQSVSPSKVSSSAGGLVTTQNLLEMANEHLIKVDERLRPIIEKYYCRVFSPEGLAETTDPFESLVSSIMSQQVSGAAAKSIKKKFISLFAAAEEESRFPHPSEVAALSIEQLRTAGLSQRKAEYVQGLSEKFTSGELSAQMLRDAPYEEMLERLLAVRGLGRWSVEMFACFALKRMDVFSVGDLGVQRGMAAFEGRDVAKLKGKGGKWKYMTEKEMLGISEKFTPYRSLFMWYMWRVEETDTCTLE